MQNNGYNNYNNHQQQSGGFGQGQSAYTGTHSGYSSFPGANASGGQYGGYQPAPPQQQQGMGMMNPGASYGQ